MTAQFECCLNLQFHFQVEKPIQQDLFFVVHLNKNVEKWENVGSSNVNKSVGVEMGKQVITNKMKRE